MIRSCGRILTFDYVEMARIFEDETRSFWEQLSEDSRFVLTGICQSNQEQSVFQAFPSQI